MHKRPENGMWLPKGGQIETVTYVYPPRHKEMAKKILFYSKSIIVGPEVSSVGRASNQVYLQTFLSTGGMNDPVAAVTMYH